MGESYYTTVYSHLSICFPLCWTETANQSKYLLAYQEAKTLYDLLGRTVNVHIVTIVNIWKKASHKQNNAIPICINLMFLALYGCEMLIIPSFHYTFHVDFIWKDKEYWYLSFKFSAEEQIVDLTCFFAHYSALLYRNLKICFSTGLQDLLLYPAKN